MGVMSRASSDFDDYLAAVPEPARTTLEQLRRMVRAAAPEATETISYRLPTFKYRGRPLVALGASKDHCSFYMMGYVPPELEPDLRTYDTGKGTIRFPADEPLPAALVRKIVEIRMAQVEGGGG